jgi:predicted enzyme related to lactoylglutathione lyase
MRAALEDRGVRVRPTATSRAGAMADVYDPDGHWISLYQPFESALEWPSGLKIQKLRALGSKSDDGGTRMDGHDLIYVFLFVQDLDRTAAFYRDALGLTHVETSSCHRGVTPVPDGVVKYDVGGTLLTTHHVPDCCHAELHKVTTASNAGVAIGFHTTDVHAAVTELETRGVKFRNGPAESAIGTTATFLDPGGHVYYLCEPPPQTHTRPGSAAVERILAATM